MEAEAEAFLTHCGQMMRMSQAARDEGTWQWNNAWSNMCLRIKGVKGGRDIM